MKRTFQIVFWRKYLLISQIWKPFLQPKGSDNKNKRITKAIRMGGWIQFTHARREARREQYSRQCIRWWPGYRWSSKNSSLPTQSQFQQVQMWARVLASQHAFLGAVVTPSPPQWSQALLQAQLLHHISDDAPQHKQPPHTSSSYAQSSNTPHTWGHIPGNDLLGSRSMDI